MSKNADEMREGARRLREQAQDPQNDHYAVSLRESAAEWERLAEKEER